MSTEGTAPGTAVKRRIHQRLQSARGPALSLSHDISDHPELAFDEHYAAGRLGQALQAAGYQVQQGAAGLDTALVATAGTGRLQVGLCAEYDALPGIGHACGHNVISAAAALAAELLAPELETLDLTLHVLGTPAEEGGGGKVIMLDQGAFDGLDAVLMVHPAPSDMVVPATLAVAMFTVEFTGFTPPSMHKEQGRSAADAATLLQVAVGLLRQHTKLTDRISGYSAEAGASPNVLPAYARLRYHLYAEDLRRLDELAERFRGCVDGAAAATGTTATITEAGPRYDSVRTHRGLADLYRANVCALGRTFDDDSEDNRARTASTDFGNVSRRIPGIHPVIGIDAAGSSNHQAPFTTACRGESGDRAVVDAGLALAWTIADLAADPTILTTR